MRYWVIRASSLFLVSVIVTLTGILVAHLRYGPGGGTVTPPAQYPPRDDIGRMADHVDPMAALPWYGLCPPWGGISVQALRDQTIARHPIYRHMDWEAARVITLAWDTTAYVRYQHQGQITWTAHQVALRKGEPMVTDGRLVIRGYCCNEVSMAPRTPRGGADAPPMTAIDLPRDAQIPPAHRTATPPDGRLPDIIPDLPGAHHEGPGAIPTLVDVPGRQPAVFPPVPGHVPLMPRGEIPREMPTPGPLPTAQVPEPQPLLLLLLGVLLLGLRQYRRWHTRSIKT